MFLGVAVGLQREQVTEEVVKGSGRRLGGWGWVHASPVIPSVSVWGLEYQYGAAGLSNRWRGGVMNRGK